MPPRKLIVAHRGARPAPPNTLNAFESAIQLGADMIEFDIRRTADDELVVFHDEAIGEQLLSSLPFAEVVRLGSPPGDRIPRFAELLDAVRGRILLDVELKESGYEDRVLDLIFDRGFHPADFVVTCFDPRAIESVKRLRPDVRAGLLVYGVTPELALQMFRESRADFLGPDCQITDDRMLAEAAAAAVDLLPWTVNEPADLRRMLDAPAILGIITDRPQDALQIRDSLARPRP